MFLGNSPAFSERSRSIDSLQSLLQTDAEDSKKVKHLNDLCWKYINIGSYDTAMHYVNAALQSAKKLNFKKGIADSYTYLAMNYRHLGKYAEALENFLSSLKIYEEIVNKRGISSAYTNIGNTYWNLSMNQEAMKYYSAALKIKTQSGETKDQQYATMVNNMGIIYMSWGMAAVDMNTSVEMYNRAMDKFQTSLTAAIIKGGIKDNVYSNTINNMGIVNAHLGAIAQSKGDVSTSEKRYKKALEHFSVSLKLNEENGYKQGIASSQIGFATLHKSMGNYPAAIVSFQKALAAGKEIGEKKPMLEACQGLVDIYEERSKKEKGRVKNEIDKKTFEYYRTFVKLNDSLFNEDNSRDIGRQEALYEQEKKQAELLREKQQQQQRMEEETGRKIILQYSGIAVFLMLMTGGYFWIFKRKSTPLAGRKDSQSVTKRTMLFFILILCFEFLLVLMDPFVDKWSSGIPLLRLGLNMGLALIILPLHGKLEKLFNAHKTGEKVSKILNSAVCFSIIALAALHSGFNTKQDSLARIVLSEAPDTVRINALHNLVIFYQYSNPDTAELLSDQEYDLALKISKTDMISGNVFLANASHSRGNLYYVTGYFSEALECYNKALTVREEMHDTLGIALTYHNIGGVYFGQGIYTTALSFYHRALKIYIAKGNKSMLAQLYNNLGAFYVEQKEFPKALENFNKSVAIKKELNDLSAIASSYNNIGLTFTYMKDFSSSLEFYHLALEIKRNARDTVNKNVAKLYNNIGLIYKMQENYPMALNYFERGLAIDKAINNNEGISNISSNLGHVFAFTGLFEKADQYLQYGLQIAKSKGFLNLEKDAYENLSLLYYKKNDFGKALDYFKKYALLNDSLFNNEKNREIGKLEGRHEFEMAEMERNIKKAEEEKIEAEIIARRDNLQYSGAFIIIILLIVFIFFRGRLAISVKFGEGLIFFTSLMLFEFLITFTEPFIDTWIAHLTGQTGVQPALKLLCNALIAMIIFPLNNFLEAMMRKNIFSAKRRWAGNT